MTDQPLSVADRPPHRILRNFAYLLSARWVRESLQTVFLIYLARHNSSTYGEFMLALSVGQVILFIAEFGLDQHLVPQLASNRGKEADVLMQFFMLKGVLLVAGVLGMIGFVYWQGYAPSLKVLVLVIGTGVGLEALGSTFFVACQVQGRQDIEGKLRAVGAGFGFGYGILSLFLGAAPLVTAFYKLIETLVNLAGSMRAVLRRSRITLRLPEFRQIWVTGKGSMVFTLMAVATTLYNNMNLFFLQRYAGAEGVAQYSATWQIIDGVSCLASNVLLRNILFPLFVNLWETDRNELTRVMRNSARWLTAAAIPIMFVLFVESDRIIRLIYGPEYGDAAWMQKYLVLTIYIAFIHNLAAFLMLAMRRERVLLGFYVTGLVFNLVLCLVLIPGSPLMGTTLAILITKAFVAVMTVSFCQWTIGLMPGRSMVHLGLAVAAGGLLYFLTIGFAYRELAETLAVIPTLVLIYTWWREFSKKPEKTA